MDILLKQLPYIAAAASIAWTITQFWLNWHRIRRKAIASKDPVKTRASQWINCAVDFLTISNIFSEKNLSDWSDNELSQLTIRKTYLCIALEVSGKFTLMAISYSIIALSIGLIGVVFFEKPLDGIFNGAWVSFQIYIVLLLHSIFTFAPIELGVLWNLRLKHKVYCSRERTSYSKSASAA